MLFETFSQEDMIGKNNMELIFEILGLNTKVRHIKLPLDDQPFPSIVYEQAFEKLSNRNEGEVNLFVINKQS